MRGDFSFYINDMKAFRFLLTVLLSASTSCLYAGNDIPLKLWYNRPATAFEEALPIGNGRLGALVYGGADTDSIYINDLTLWTGKPVELNEGGDAHRWIPVIRKELFAGNYKNADILQHLVQGHNSEYYQSLALLTLTDLNASPAEGRSGEDFGELKRSLDIDSAVCRDTYHRGGVTYIREYFASAPDSLIAIRIRANRSGAINCRLALTSVVPHQVKATGRQLTMTGHAIGDPLQSIHFCAILKVKTDDGQVAASDSSLTVNGASEVTVYFVNRTSFNGFDKHPVTAGAPYLAKATDDIWHTENITYNECRQRHVADYKRLFDRFRFTLSGAKPNYSRTTEEQLMAYSDQGERNPYLEMLYMQYGRYLLISCSRTPGVPANLQGLWAPQKYSPWRGNYTININLEENYWPAEVTDLGELVMPVDGLVRAMAATGRHTAAHYYGIDEGWCAGHNSDIWAMTNPVGTGKESPKWSNWNMGGAWLVQTLWDHYDFTRDTHYLRNTAYPLMKGAADFMLRWLVESPVKRGELITAPCTSPEAEYINDKGYQGCTFYGGTSDLAIVRELFTNTLRAAEILNIDAGYRQQLRSSLDHLAPYKIGKRGNLQEWYYDWDDQDWHHRHQSHLLGVYPFKQISVYHTPLLANAAIKTLEIKGDNSTGWSTGWRISLWARLHRRDKAYQMLRKLLTYVRPANYNDPKHRPAGGTYPNLFDAHPPFQIDGNFGGTAGVCEMLVQSDGALMELLPALPEAWPAGSVSGLKARGNYRVDMTWKNGKVTLATITALKGGKLTVKYNGRERVLSFKTGEKKNL